MPRKAVQACDKIKKINLLGIDFHILNGNRTEVGEFPHQVVLGYLDEVDSSKPPSWDCGGSLISRVSKNLKDFTFNDYKNLIFSEFCIDSGYASIHV